MKPTLVVLAAGLGTRYGGLKQLDAVGPNGETIIDYSVYDAVRAGFGEVVFVIRHYFEDAFREKVSSKFDGVVKTAYAHQELDACLGDFEPSIDRDKPWGTGHAILVARDVVDRPFAVINADDYYGPNSFDAILSFITAKDTAPDDYAMVGYTLKNTLSDYGAVSRGVCECDEQMFLRKIVERKEIEKHADGARYFDADGAEHPLTGGEIVSMNLWGFQPSVFDRFQSHFEKFLRDQGDQNSSELLIPSVTDGLIKSGKATIKVLRTDDSWFGVTYRRDKAIAIECVRRLIDRGIYPERLWAQR
ncbi:MAG: sugar phosphate nucleotidyltransferase [Planctomycetota bacterium]|nr:sugar phosphate nucleotidyltransferase [Planctomycetota bacterium]